MRKKIAKIALILGVFLALLVFSPPLAVICLGLAVSIFVMVKGNWYDPETGQQISTLIMLVFLVLAFLV